MLWNILVQFMFRLTFGLAAAMLATSPARVAAGYFRVHLWVTLGLATFAVLAIASGQAGYPPRGLIVGLAITVAIASYVGSVIWLYERPGAGRVALACLASVGFAAAVLALGQVTWLKSLDVLSSGLFLGTVIAAMFLGHWYLNHPGMELAPLRRLILAIAFCGLVRVVVCGSGLWMAVASGQSHQGLWWTLLAIRWLAGIVGTLVLAALTWQTLKIPNTQSATGILYVAVVTVFLGELSSQFLTATSVLPL